MDAPAINTNYFSDPADLATLREGVRISRRIATESPMAKYLSAVREGGQQGSGMGGGGRAHACTPVPHQACRG